MRSWFDITEYQKKPDSLADHMLWGALIAPGIIANKDGSFQRTFRFRGPDLASSTQGELVTITAQINNVIKRLGSNWALYSEAQRVTSQKYSLSDFPDPVTLLIDEERKHFFNAGHHYENYYYFTLQYLPPSEQEDKIGKFFYEQNLERKKASGQIHLKNFRDETDRVFGLFAQYVVEAAWLTDDETLTYLHSCVSPKRQSVKTPEIPMYLDSFICDSPLLGGFEPKLGDHHLRVVTINGFPGSSVPGILNSLNRLNFEYRWVTRFIPMDKLEAQAELKKYRKNWFAKRQGAIAAMTESAMVDNDAVNKSIDADAALQEVSADVVSYGHFTACVVVCDQELHKAERKAEAIEKTIMSLGFTTVIEKLNAVDAWFGSLPGHAYANVRKPLLNTLNLIHIFPLSAIWAGPFQNRHLDAPVLMYAHTSDSTPFRLDLHVGDVGHTMIVGPTGAGKSVLLATLAAQFRRYRDCQVYLFDKGGSCRALTAGVGGNFFDLAEEYEGTLAFQPLADIDDATERSWAAEWLHDILRDEKVEITPEVKKTVWTALGSLASAPQSQRTITGYCALLQDLRLRQALEQYTLMGAHGKLFDSSSDNLNYGRWQCFEMSKLMNTPAVIPATLGYLFHKLEQRFTGAPTLLILDECWLFLDNPIFAAKIREWLKVLRKANVSVVFATQSLKDVLSSEIAPSVLESCLTKIYLANPSALDEQIAATYQSFGLNETEIGIIATATPKRHYYYKSLMGSRLFELALGEVTLAYVGASSPEDQVKVRQIQASQPDVDTYNLEWLKYKNLDYAAELYHDLVGRQPEGELND
jgi:type IV secretion/conjugal transfer VirB4 family ATPase